MAKDFSPLKKETKKEKPEAEEKIFEIKPEAYKEEEKVLEKEKIFKPEEELIPPEEEKVKPAPAPPIAPPTVPSVEKSEIQKEVEEILAEDLYDIYEALDVATKEAFRKKGEEIASKITALIQEVKIRVKEIFRLIKEWLKMIPKVNRFFLEQEAKIKTDKIIHLAKTIKENKKQS